MSSSAEPVRRIAAFLRGDIERWGDLALEPAAFIDLCRTEEILSLSFERLSECLAIADWPPDVREALASAARTGAAEELVRGAEIRAVLGELAAAGLRPVLIKGTPLAYSRYSAPASRPRGDTDLVVSPSQVDAARRVLASHGYRTTVHCDDLFSQFEVQRTDQLRIVHVFDVHWKISTQPVFADMLTYDELLERAVPVPALGPSAAAPCDEDALLLACAHPVMHHRNEARLLWMYDVHLLASGLTPGAFEAFALRARLKKMAAVCAHELRLARAFFGTDIPDGVFASLAAAGHGEPSAEYLASERRWHHEVAASVRSLPGLGDRVRLMRRVLFPDAAYMLGSYHLAEGPLARLLLPLLYVHRNVRGVSRILMGKK